MVHSQGKSKSTSMDYEDATCALQTKIYFVLLHKD